MSSITNATVMEDRKRFFSYGDKVRHKNGGPVRTVTDIGPTAYYFADGGFALIDDQDCYTIVQKSSGFFLVGKSLNGLPLRDHLRHGYEDRDDFAAALRRLIEHWGGRVGERIGERNKFLMLRFHDTPGGRPDETWLPLYLLKPVDKPVYLQNPEHDNIEEELDRIFGFD